MKLLFDYFPIAIFFIVYKIAGIFIATAAIMAASLVQVGVYWLIHKKFEKLYLITLALVMLLGIPTLLLHDAVFIKWKPTAIYWVFAIVFLGSQFIGKKTIIQRLMESKLNLTKSVWQRLNVGWVIFFVIMGILNLYVAYYFSTDIWVDFKLFGTLVLTVAFIIVQAIYISKYLDLKTNKPLKSRK